jgi:mycothiol synthase
VTSQLRAPTDADVTDVVRLMSENWPEPVDEDFVRRAWSSPGFDRERDARIEPNAYADVRHLDCDQVWINLRGSPTATLVDWAGARASEGGARILSGSWIVNESVIAELRRRDFHLINHSHRMTIELDAAIADPIWPEGIQVRTFRDGDERGFYDAQQETFADTWEPIDEPYDEWAHWLLEAPSFDPELWFLAQEAGETAGFAICKVHPGDSELGWAQTLGVRRAWRGRGLGRALLLHAFAEFKRRGLRRAGLGVDAENPTGATALYESVGMSAVGRFELYEKVGA